MLRCSPEAFAKCPTSHLCGSPHEATFAEGSECDEFNQQVLDKPMTNADRIRAMSDEELEDFLFAEEWMCDTYNSCSVCPLRGEKGCISILEWLKQPAEEGADNG